MALFITNASEQLRTNASELDYVEFLIVYTETG